MFLKNQQKLQTQFDIQLFKKEQNEINFSVHRIKKIFEREIKACPSQKFKFNWNLSLKDSNIND